MLRLRRRVATKLKPNFRCSAPQHSDQFDLRIFDADRVLRAEIRRFLGLFLLGPVACDVGASAPNNSNKANPTPELD
jgi:hypothetical protein